VGKDWSFSSDAACSGDGKRIGFEGEGTVFALEKSFKGCFVVIVVVADAVVADPDAAAAAFCAFFLAFFLLPFAMFFLFVLCSLSLAARARVLVESVCVTVKSLGGCRGDTGGLIFEFFFV
jgi:hypothetical protein